MENSTCNDVVVDIPTPLLKSSTASTRDSRANSVPLIRTKIDESETTTALVVESKDDADVVLRQHSDEDNSTRGTEECEEVNNEEEAQATKEVQDQDDDKHDGIEKNSTSVTPKETRSVGISVEIEPENSAKINMGELTSGSKTPLPKPTISTSTSTTDDQKNKSKKPVKTISSSNCANSKSITTKPPHNRREASDGNPDKSEQDQLIARLSPVPKIVKAQQPESKKKKAFLSRLLSRVSSAKT